MSQVIQELPMGRHELRIRQGLLMNVLKMLPPFDMKWPDEEKKLWWEAYHNAIEAMISLAHEEDRLELFEHSNLSEAERLYKLMSKKTRR